MAPPIVTGKIPVMAEGDVVVAESGQILGVLVRVDGRLVARTQGAVTVNMGDTVRVRTPKVVRARPGPVPAGERPKRMEIDALTAPLDRGAVGAQVRRAMTAIVDAAVEAQFAQQRDRPDTARMDGAYDEVYGEGPQPAIIGELPKRSPGVYYTGVDWGLGDEGGPFKDRPAPVPPKRDRSFRPIDLEEDS